MRLGGFLVGPEEIEAVIQAVPGVAGVQVVAAERSLRLERIIVALIVLEILITAYQVLAARNSAVPRPFRAAFACKPVDRTAWNENLLPYRVATERRGRGHPAV
jgi:acyl-coenzyme A synthetase/AMP-(fatty) acid ligase